jgi:hypothetical protein
VQEHFDDALYMDRLGAMVESMVHGLPSEDRRPGLMATLRQEP